jgi:glycerol-3-phosphate dehydrogenase
MLVNAAGAWVNDVLHRTGIVPRQQLRLVKGSHLILRRQFEGAHAYLLQSPDRRVLFAIPFEGKYTLLGTTDMPFDGDPSSVHISAAEQEYLLAGLNRFLRKPATVADIIGSYAGVRPLFDDGSRALAQQVSRDYHLEWQHGAGGAPVLSVYGGKITTYRRLAEAAMERLIDEEQVPRSRPWTGEEALPGGDFPDADLQRFTAHALARWPRLPPALVERLARLYGTRMAHILGNAQDFADLGQDFGATLTLAEVRHLVQHEWVRSAEDILWRRTRLGLELPQSAVHDLQDAVAQLLR